MWKGSSNKAVVYGWITANTGSCDLPSSDSSPESLSDSESDDFTESDFTDTDFSESDSGSELDCGSEL